MKRICIITGALLLVCCHLVLGQNAVCPVDIESVWSTDDAYHETSATRNKICLNGYWQFWPEGGPLTQSKTDWCWQKVPGSWPASHRWGLFPYPFEPVMSKRWQREFPVDLERGNWHARNDQTGKPIAFDQVTNAWYQRDFSVPETWAEKRIVLSAEYIERAAYVYVDNVYVGSMYWPYGELDITDHLTPGKKSTLSILVVATGAGVRGLAGDLWIEAQPLGPTIDDVYLIPSVRESSITVKAVIRGAVSNAVYSLSGNARLNDQDVFSFKAVKAKVVGDSVEITVPWVDAALWDFDNPRIHSMRISLCDERGEVLDESLPISLGFREFDIKGKDFFLNGTPVHFRATFYKPIGASTGLADKETVRRVVSRLKKAGYNLLVSSIYSSGPGQLHYPRQFLETCDSMGMAVQLQLNKATQFMTYSKEDGWQLPPEGLEQWKTAVNPQIIRQRQHPSLFFWASNANIFAGVEKANPHGWVLKERPVQRMTGWEMFSEILEVSDDHIKSMDGARPVISLGNGNYKDLISSYIYPNFYPRQEQREMPSRWNKSGLKPLMIAEWGNPADISFSSHRNNKPRWPSVGFHAEPMLVEYSAIFDGDQAYALDAAGISLYQRLDQLHAQPFSIYHWTRQHAVRFNMYQNFFKTKIDTLRQVMPIWRAYGVSDIGILESYTQRQIADPGIDHWTNTNRLSNLKTPGVKPDNHVWYEAALTYPEADRFFEVTKLGRAWTEMSNPVLCFIGGHPEQDGGIANCAANSFTGSELRCSSIMINDTLNPLQFSCTWKLMHGELLLEQGQDQCQVPAGGRIIQPMSLLAPATSGVVTLKASFMCDGKEWDAERNWNILPAAVSTSKLDITLYDPVGSTIKDFNRLGISFNSISSNGIVTSACKLLVIGQGALDTKTPLPFIKTAVESGIDILVLAQKGAVLSHRLGFRYSDVIMRKLSIRRSGASELIGVTPEMLQNWAGASSLLDSYPNMTSVYHYSPPIVDWLGLKTTRFFHWGNTGSVGSTLIEKPSIAGFNVILDGATDMNYSGLLYVYDGHCRVTLCQLDLIGRTEPDPVADTILVNLLNNEDVKNHEELSCWTVGLKAQEWLTTLKIPFHVVKNISEIPANAIVVLGPDAGDAIDLADIEQRVKQGLHILAIGWDQTNMSQVANLTITTEQKKLVYEPPLLNTPSALIGVGPADLFWHGPIRCAAIEAVFEKKVATQDTSTYWTPYGTLGYVRKSNGEIVFLQPTPDDVKYDWQPHARDKILRVMGIVLLNWKAQASGINLIHDLSVPPVPAEKRWDAGYYTKPATLKDDTFHYHPW